MISNDHYADLNRQQRMESIATGEGCLIRYDSIALIPKPAWLVILFL